MKNISLKYSLIISSFVLFLCSNGACETDLLKKVPKLQKTAQRSSGGAMGCGIGTITLITSKGKISVQSGLDPIHVFGHIIVVADLIELLKSRAESNRTGNKGPMADEVSNLCYVILDTLSLAKDPASISVIADLLTDKDDTVRGWAAIALYRMGNSDSELQEQIQKIIFPKMAIESAHGRGEKPPRWVKTEE